MLLRCLTAVILLSPTVSGQNNDGSRPVASTQHESVSWQAPFRQLSLADAESRLVVMLITDEDPLVMTTDEQQQSPKPWCDSIFARSLRGVFEHRPDLRDCLVLQHLAAGTPANLCGGKIPGFPLGAMLAVLDHNYRLLAYMVGIPETKPLIAFLEDAEEVRLLMHRFNDQPHRTGDEIFRRSTDRLDRRWAAALNEQWLVMGGRQAMDAEQNDVWMRSRLSLIATVFRRVYLKDVALRFGLTEKLDRTRLAILEQHPEVRRPWCESMIPFLACIDFKLAWRSVVESVWNRHSVSSTDDASELLAWWDDLGVGQSVVLALRPPLLASMKDWPPNPGEGIAASRGLGWDAVQKVLVTEPYREVAAHELSYFMADREIEPIDVRLPSRVRYLYFESTKKKPILIREDDIPGRHLAYLKRTRN